MYVPIATIHSLSTLTTIYTHTISTHIKLFFPFHRHTHPHLPCLPRFTYSLLPILIISLFLVPSPSSHFYTPSSSIFLHLLSSSLIFLLVSSHLFPILHLVFLSLSFRQLPIYIPLLSTLQTSYKYWHPHRDTHATQHNTLRSTQ